MQHGIRYQITVIKDQNAELTRRREILLNKLVLHVTDTKSTLRFARRGGGVDEVLLIRKESLMGRGGNSFFCLFLHIPIDTARRAEEKRTKQ